jgi:hypothetical protein
MPDGYREDFGYFSTTLVDAPSCQDG